MPFSRDDIQQRCNMYRYQVRSTICILICDNRILHHHWDSSYSDDIVLDTMDLEHSNLRFCWRQRLPWAVVVLYMSFLLSYRSAQDK